MDLFMHGEELEKAIMRMEYLYFFAHPTRPFSQPARRIQGFVVHTGGMTMRPETNSNDFGGFWN